MLSITNAVAAIVASAVAVGYRCTTLRVDGVCRKDQLAWEARWCVFIHRLRSVALTLPAAGHVVTALGVSLAAVIQEELPKVLAGPLAEVVYGTLASSFDITEVQNATVSFCWYMQAASLLGEEMVRFGRSRVARAVFHGDALNAASRSIMHSVDGGELHVVDVLIWILVDSPAGKRKLLGKHTWWDNEEEFHGWSPRVAEIGVSGAVTSARLLAMMPSVRWVGVDPYQSASGLHGDAQELAVAKTLLRPYLGKRGQLFVARSSEVEEDALGPEPFDLVFVDGEHTYRGATEDLAIWSPRVRPGGVVAGHDYAAYYDGVSSAANEALPRGSTLHLGPNTVFWWHKPVRLRRFGAL